MFFELLAAVLSKLSYFALHLQGKNSFPKPLSAFRERECFLLAQKGSMEARNEIIEHNLRLVAHIARKYVSDKVDQEDLLSIGTIGLIKGITTFDASKGARLATYAARCVENAILTPMTSCTLGRKKDILADFWLSGRAAEESDSHHGG